MHRLTGRLLVSLVLGAAAGGGCSRSTLAPTDPAAGPAASNLAARPGSGPTATPHALAFADPGQVNSPGRVEGAGSVYAWVTGSSATGAVLASVPGSAFTLTVTDANALPPGTSTGDPCTASDKAILTAAGVLSSPVSGTLKINVDQNGSGSFSGPQMDWELSGIRSGTDTWKISGLSTVNYLPIIEGDSTGLTVTLLWGKANFVRYPGGSKKSDLVVGCRTDLKFALTPQ